MATPNYGVALHAGTCDIWNNDTTYQLEVEKILKEVVEDARTKLRSGETALDIVQGVVTSLEDCPLFNAGKGAVLNEDAEHELEAAIACGTSGAYGAVAAARYIRNPIKAARAVMEEKRQSVIVGSAADDFALKSGIAIVSNDYFTTPIKKARWQIRSCKALGPSEDLETVGAIALDIHGNLAAAGSTGGLTFKRKGRVGDTAIIGAGLAVDENVAVVCSGQGEDILRHSVAGKVAALSEIKDVNEATTQVITKKAEKAPSACAILAINSKGQIAVQSSGRVFPMACCTSSSSTSSVLSTTIPLLLQHTIHCDALSAAGLTRYPITPGHTVVACHGVSELMSLPWPIFWRVLYSVRELSATLTAGMSVHRCGLACDGSGIISLLPLHGLSKDWKAVLHAEEQYDAVFPGYLTSKDGPRMTDDVLEKTCSRVAATTGITRPFNNQFYGSKGNQNLFARIIRGEVTQWRVWEDNAHVAFLTPFGNTPGFTVLVPRKQLGSDILNLGETDFAQLMQAAHKVAQHLKKAFDVKRCGIFFEGYEIDYAHVKLVPVHDQITSEGRLFNPIAAPIPFQKIYKGFLTTQLGPLASDLNAIADDAKRLRELHFHRIRIEAPKSWKQPRTHYQTALQSSWYTSVFSLQNTLFHATMSFFQDRLEYKYASIPVTTDSISSPMGLGSDSLPVEVDLLGQETYLADSMQFTLEYVLRMEEGLKGAYYVGCSFRGEDYDSMHLNQFYHAECELLGTLDDGITVAEDYVLTITKSLLDNNLAAIRAIAGTISHVDDLFSLAKKHRGHFPRITLSDALTLPEIADNAHTWKYAVAHEPSKGRALTRAGERILIAKFGGAVWLTEMDHLSVPFYQAFVPHANNAQALCADLLMGPGEILGLGQRHTHACDVSEALIMHEVPEDKYEWYLSIRDEVKGGKCLQTTGWGMGMERYLAWLLKHDDIRDMVIIPRMKGMRFAP